MKATTDFKDITVFGARGHTLMILRSLEEYWQGKVRIRALIDDIDNGFLHPGQREDGPLGTGTQVPVISSEDRLRDFPDLPVLITVTNTVLRRKIVHRLQAEGATLATAVCPGSLHVDQNARYGAGVVCMPWTRIGPNVTIGDCTIVLADIVGHDVEIGEFSTLASEVFISGHVMIGKDVNVAPRAVICNGSPDQSIEIGDGAVIGIGAVVPRNVAPGARMVGNPAMTVERWKKFNRWIEAQED